LSTVRNSLKSGILTSEPRDSLSIISQLGTNSLEGSELQGSTRFEISRLIREHNFKEALEIYLLGITFWAPKTSSLSSLKTDTSQHETTMSSSLITALRTNADQQRVETIVEVDPDTLQKADFSGKYPLHIACENKVGAKTLQFLIENASEQLEKQDNKGNTPLHYACQHSDYKTEIETLLLAEPRAVQKFRFDGATPLHVACLHQTNSSALETLVDSWSQGLQAVNQAGQTPLHSACLREDGSYLEVLRYLVSKSPDACQKKDSEGRLPLHCLCQYTTDPKQVQLVIQTWPEAVQNCSKGGSTPLHVAIGRTKPASLNIVQVLVDAWPDAIGAVDSNGCTVLHVACQVYGSADGRDPGPTRDKTVLPYLINHFPDAVSVPRPDGWVALQIACRHAVDFSAIQDLVKAWPDAAAHVNPDGRHALHYACRYRVREEVIRLLVETNSDTVSQAEPKTGWIPLHAACRYTNQLVIIQLLLDAWPDGVRAVTETEGWNPLHAACAHDQHSVDIIQFLMEAYPDAVQIKSAQVQHGNLPLHEACQVEHTDESVIRVLLESYPESVRIRTDDECKYLPIHLACRYSSSLCAIHVLWKADPDSVKDPVESSGRLPLHEACARVAPVLAVIQFLVLAFPAAMTMADSQENKPLDLAKPRRNREVNDFLNYVDSEIGWQMLDSRDRHEAALKGFQGFIGSQERQGCLQQSWMCCRLRQARRHVEYLEELLEMRLRLIEDDEGAEDA
jgi:ankyrin repeat protein